MATARRTTRLYLRLALSLLLGAALVATTAVPGFAQPDNNEVPDPGARPAPAGEVPLPDGSFARPPTAGETLDGPLAAEIAEIQIDISTRTTELQSVEPAVGPAEQDLTQAEVAWRTANQTRMAAQAAFDELVADSYRGAAALPADLFIPELRGLSAHAHVLPVEAPLGAEAAARELVASRAAEQEAASWFETAQVTQQDLVQRQRTLEAELADLTAELEALQERNAELLAEAERAREAAAQNQDFPVSQPVAGFRAGEAAVAAVNFALSQLGKPYLWGAEGPDRYDCSGLVFASYNHARARFGATTVPVLPRVAADQYFGTQDRLVSRSATVARRGLLPGDLVFFASGLSWQSVHHVGMYVGNGYMVHAPNRNEVVKVSPVWWNRFFAATRVVEAVRVSPDPDRGGTPDPEPGPPPPSSGGGGVIRPTPPDPTTPGPQPTMVTVPNLSGLSPIEAEAEVRAAGLTPVTGTPITEECVAAEAGTVVRQQPAAGESAQQGSAVTHQVCNRVPAGLVGLTRAEAEAALARAGMSVQVETVDSPAQLGQVVGTVPGAGEVVEGSVVLQVSRGTPSLTNRSCEEAITLLRELGLEIEIIGPAPDGTVQAQDPPAGAAYPADGVVTLTGCAPAGTPSPEEPPSPTATPGEAGSATSPSPPPA